MNAGFIKTHPLLFWVIVGIAIRLLIAPFLSRTYDVATWGQIIENIRACEGLYDVQGYYYTPLWGYFLDVIAAISCVIPNMGTLSTTADVNFLEFFQYADTKIPTLGFAIFIKMPLILFDLAVGYVIYRLIQMQTDDETAAMKGFAAWMVLAPAIFVSCVGGMFDNLSILLLLSGIICLFKNRIAVSGILMGFATMLKIFPGLALMPMLFYILSSENDGQNKLKSASLFLTSSIATMILIILPPILNGQTEEVLFMFTSRMNGNGSAEMFTANGLMTFLEVLALIIGSFVIYHLLKKYYVNGQKALLCSVTTMIGLLAGIAFSQQYVVEILPLLLILLLSYRIGSKYLMIILSALFMAYVMIELPALLLTFEESTSLLSLSTLETMATFIVSSGLFGNGSYILALVLAVLISVMSLIPFIPVLVS